MFATRRPNRNGSRMGWEGRLRPEMQLRLCNSGRYEHRQQVRESIVVVQRLVEVRWQGLKEVSQFSWLFGSDARGNLLSGLKNVEDRAGRNAWGNAWGCRAELEADSGTMDRLEL